MLCWLRKGSYTRAWVKQLSPDEPHLPEIHECFPKMSWHGWKREEDRGAFVWMVPDEPTQTITVRKRCDIPQRCDEAKGVILGWLRVVAGVGKQDEVTNADDCFIHDWTKIRSVVNRRCVGEYRTVIGNTRLRIAQGRYGGIK